jgi:hypothetical protein
VLAGAPGYALTPNICIRQSHDAALIALAGTLKRFRISAYKSSVICCSFSDDTNAPGRPHGAGFRIVSRSARRGCVDADHASVVLAHCCVVIVVLRACETKGDDHHDGVIAGPPGPIETGQGVSTLPGRTGRGDLSKRRL